MALAAVDLHKTWRQFEFRSIPADESEMVQSSTFVISKIDAILHINERRDRSVCPPLDFFFFWRIKTSNRWKKWKK